MHMTDEKLPSKQKDETPEEEYLPVSERDPRSHERVEDTDRRKAKKP